MRSFNEKKNPILVTICDAMETSSNGVALLKSDGSLLAANQVLIRQLEYTDEDFCLCTIFEIDSSMSLRSWKKLWKKLKKEQNISIDSEHVTANRNIYPVELNAVLLDIKGDKIAMLSSRNLMEANRYKDLLAFTSSIAHIGSWEWNLVKDKVIVNNELKQLLQLPREFNSNIAAVSGMAKESLSKEDYKLFSDTMRKIVKKGKPGAAELSVHVNGEYRAFSLNARPELFEDEVIKVYGTLQSIDAITQKRTDEMYVTKHSMDYARDMIYWVTRDGNINYANQSACDKIGYDAEELLGRHIGFIGHDPGMDFDRFWEQLKTENSLDIETEIHTKDGKTIPVSSVSNYIHFRGREFNCIYIRDLSIRKKNENLLKLAKHTLDQSPSTIFWLNEDGSFRYFNNAFVRMTGYGREKIMAMNILDFFPRYGRADFEANWANLKLGNKINGLEENIRLADGMTVACEMNVSMVRVETEEFSITILNDITERKKKEQQIAMQLLEIEQLQQETLNENVALKEEIELQSDFSNIISRDPNYKKVLHQVEQVADTNATVLILGETGTGKELLARAIHKLSVRADRQMIKVNCGALPENLIESELFGHEKGAFTGAHQKKTGRFERANNSTIFLDEIGELPLDLQTKLLRVLQESEIERVGGQKTIQVDVRVIAATNRNLEDEVREGRFREDLYYRLNVFPIYNIPLRERKEDIPILVNYFVDKYNRSVGKDVLEISASSLNKLKAYDFLGNVRELENLVERAVILSTGKVLDIKIPEQEKPLSASSAFLTMEEMQKQHILDALRRTEGKITGINGAGALLGMNDKTLASRIRKLGISRLDYMEK